jgi:NADH-quinone oxidoreductase subunit L
MNTLTNLLTAVALAAPEGGGDHAGGAEKAAFLLGEVIPEAGAAGGPAWAGLILLLPILSMIVCGVFAAMRVKSKLPAYTTVGFLGASFVTVVALYAGYENPIVIHLFDWLNLSWGGADGAVATTFSANFALYVDKLTLLWMLFVTGLGTLIALYASEYMEPDQGVGYCRFFAGVSIFLFAMSCLVMGDNLVLLYLGWEGVGFASYMLIGYYYTRPEAVAAAKKAFIVNRIGDLGLALGIYMTWHAYGTVEYAELFRLFAEGEPATEAGGWMTSSIPFLFMLGAFGKSAQLPLYVWLPDAMEGPTPVSALIHAATMVTAGVYLLCRVFPLMELHPYALPTVAWVGGLTALLAATIGMAQYDIKRIMAYSTVSQLGYMFMGVGLMTTFAGAFHVFTHAFFKAVLFLTCGAIMHGFAGQLDLRKLSGLRKMDGWKIVSYTMLFGCLCLAGFPYITSGFFSKDLIMAEAFMPHAHDYGFRILGFIAILTALLTAYYTFRVWFRVCAGPVSYEMGDDHHGDDHGHDDGHGHGDDHGHGHDTPHPPRMAINFVLLAITAVSVLVTIGLLIPGEGGKPLLKKWMMGMVEGSSAGAGLGAHPAAGATGFWADPHVWMPLVASITTLVGIGIAAYLHLFNRAAADKLRAGLLASPATRWLPTAMEHKWYVDEVYHAIVRAPLWIGGKALWAIDKWLLDGFVVDGTASLPRRLGKSFQPLQNGLLQSYAVSMAGGVALVALLVLYMPELLTALGLTGGQG